MTPAATPARTQAERRSATRAKLIDATIEAIVEVGYHRTSLGEVCSRSGVSKGGLFRHFDSRTDLVVAAAEEVGRRHLAAFHELRDSMLTIEDQLRFARTQIRDETNSVWLELLIAARTEPELRERLAPAVKALYDGIEEITIADQLDSAADPDTIRLAVTSVLHMLDGEAILRHTYPRPALEDERLTQTANLYGVILTGT